MAHVCESRNPASPNLFESEIAQTSILSSTNHSQVVIGGGCMGYIAVIQTLLALQQGLLDRDLNQTPLTLYHYQGSESLAFPSEANGATDQLRVFLTSSANLTRWKQALLPPDIADTFFITTQCSRREYLDELKRFVQTVIKTNVGLADKIDYQAVEKSFVFDCEKVGNEWSVSSIDDKGQKIKARADKIVIATGHGQHEVPDIFKKSDCYFSSPLDLARKIDALAAKVATHTDSLKVLALGNSIGFLEAARILDSRIGNIKEIELWAAGNSSWAYTGENFAHIKVSQLVRHVDPFSLVPLFPSSAEEAPIKALQLPAVDSNSTPLTFDFVINTAPFIDGDFRIDEQTDGNGAKAEVLRFHDGLMEALFAQDSVVMNQYDRLASVDPSLILVGPIGDWKRNWSLKEFSYRCQEAIHKMYGHM